jgi:hypothetical protein
MNWMRFLLFPGFTTRNMLEQTEDLESGLGFIPRCVCKPSSG